MFWLLSILFRLLVYYAPVEGQFHADTLLDYVTVVDRGSGTETAVLPCKLVLDDPNYSERVDLRWYISKPDDTSNPEQAVYQWTEFYDGKLGYGDARFRRDSSNSEERYYLEIVNVTMADEGRYCCDLNVNSDPRDVDCLDLHYAYLDLSNFKMSCDEDSTKTSGIPVPATVTATITDYAPAEDHKPGEARNKRELTIYNADNPSKNTKTTDYEPFGYGRFNISGTYTVTVRGLHAFTASLSYKWGNFEEKTIECEYIDLCDPNPCQHGGTCSRTPTSYECKCVPPYCGKDCETVAGFCDSNPCQNNGTCSIASCEVAEVCSCEISCECQEGYTGERCTDPNTSTTTTTTTTTEELTTIPSSTTQPSEPDCKKSTICKDWPIGCILVAAAATAIIILCIACFICLWRKKKANRDTLEEEHNGAGSTQTGSGRNADSAGGSTQIASGRNADSATESTQTASGRNADSAGGSTHTGSGGNADSKAQKKE